MTDLRKAAEMALEALMDANKFEYKDEIAALRQALAQPEQEPYGYVWTSVRDGMEVRFSHKFPNDFYKAQDVKPVYTAPPKREWVGLMLNDITGHMCDCADDDGTYQTSCFIDYAKAIEQKLKDLNT